MTVELLYNNNNDSVTVHAKEFVNHPLELYEHTHQADYIIQLDVSYYGQDFPKLVALDKILITKIIVTLSSGDSFEYTVPARLLTINDSISEDYQHDVAVILYHEHNS